MMQKAANYEVDVLDWFRSRGGDVNYTKLYRERRYYFGALGEYVFEQFLIDRHKDFRYAQVVGMPDSGDFILHWHDHCQRKADVKTATQSFHRNIMMPEAQAGRHRYHFYVGVKLCDGVGEVWGYCNIDQFKLNERGFDDNHIPTLYLPLKEMNDISELLSLVVDG